MRNASRTYTAAVHRGIDIDVDAGVPVVGVVLGVPLDPADDAAVELDDVTRAARFREVFLDRREQVGASAPTFVDLRCPAYGDEVGYIRSRRRSQRGELIRPTRP